MSGFEALMYVISISFVIGLVSGLMVRKKGYSFGQYFVAGFIASCGILGIVFKIIMDYL
jgi:hypothetical protein